MKIRRRVYASGKVAWQLDLGESGGKRVQRSYGSEKAALKAMADARKTMARHGAAGALFSPGEMAEIVIAKERLEAVGASISDAVEHYLRSGSAVRESVTVEELVRRFRAAKEDDGCSSRYLRQLGVSLGAFAKHCGSTAASGIVREDVETWLRSNSWSPKTRNNYVGDVRALCEWGRTRGLIRTNPVVGISRAKLGDGEIGTLSVGQCGALLRGGLARPDVMGFIVLGMFGGLRPAEIQRLDWSAVDLRARTVVVAGSQAKTRRRRVVDLCPNAVAWIKASKVERNGKIVGRWWDARWRLFRAAMGWDVGVGEKGVKRRDSKPIHGPWPHNALRHTYASMHYAMHQNEALLQAQMGHENAAMLHRHYRALRTRSEAAKFWALRPLEL